MASTRERWRLDENPNAGLVPLNREEPTAGRLLVVIPAPFYSDRGTPIAIAQVIRALREQAYEVDVLTYPIGRELDLPGVRIFRSANPLRFRHVGIGFSWRKLMLDIPLSVSMYRLLRRRRYRCVHAVEEAAFPASVLSRRLGLPLVYDMQSCMPEQMRALALFRPRPIQAVLRSSERWLVRRADVIACSLGLRDYVRSVHPQARVQEWRFPGQRPSVSPDQVNRIRQELGLHRGTKVVFYGGTFEPYQGLDKLLAAAPRVLEQRPETVFILVGENEASALELSTEAQGLKATGRLRIVPRQDRDVIPGFLDLSDVVVSPRVTGSNLPLKIYDYMAAGRPIVATDIPPHRELLNSERAELVAPSADAMAAAILRLLTDPERAHRLGQAARSYSEENLGWPRFAEGVKDIYRMALEGTAAGGPS